MSTKNLLKSTKVHTSPPKSTQLPPKFTPVPPSSSKFIQVYLESTQIRPKSNKIFLESTQIKLCPPKPPKFTQYYPESS